MHSVTATHRPKGGGQPFFEVDDMPRRKERDEEPVRTEIGESENEGGIEPETEALAPSIDELQAAVDQLTTQLQEERAKAEEEHDRYLRALADFSNYRRRHQEEYAHAVQFASQELILKILPAIDNFERALQAAEQQHSYESLVEGVRLTLRQLKDVLEREGVQPIEAIGQQFDPMMHEAVQRIETDDYPENTVVDEVQTGYTYREHVIRPSKVVVAAAPRED